MKQVSCFRNSYSELLPEKNVSIDITVRGKHILIYFIKFLTYNNEEKQVNIAVKIRVLANVHIQAEPT